jgi:dihydrolipoamide dehydrogenase
LDSMVVSSKEVDDHVVLEIKHKDKTFTVESEVVLVSVGRIANSKSLQLDKANVTSDDRGLIVVDKQCRTSNKNIYAIGDVVAGLQLAHKASYEAKIVAEVLVGKNVEVDYKAIPAVCYTTTEIATTGLSKQEAESKGLKVGEFEFPLAANSRSIASNSTQGFTTLLINEESKQIVGAQFVGQNASEIITTLTLAVELGLTAEDLALTIFPHPSVAEAIMDNAELAMGYPIHI